MKKKYLNIFLLSIILVFAACSNLIISYKHKQAEKAKNATGKSVAVEETSNINSLKETLNAEEKWVETIETKRGTRITINAKVEIPDVSNMYTYELAQNYYYSDEKKRIVEHFLKPGSIQVDINEFVSKEKLSGYIESYENMLKELDGVNKSKIENEIKRLEVQLMFAPNASEIKEEKLNYSGDYYKGVREDKEYKLIFNMDGDRSVSQWQLTPLKYAKFNSIGANGFDFKRNATSMLSQSDINNKCTMTKEEAEKQAEQICKDLKIPTMWVQNTMNIRWVNSNQEEEVNGYCINLSRVISGVAADVTTYTTDYPGIYSKKYPPYRQETVRIAINDNGIIYMEYAGIMTEGRKGPAVKLLNFEQIKEIFKNEFDTWGEDETYSMMKLSYVRIVNEKKDAVYSYIPVWRLSTRTETSLKARTQQTDSYNCILINAIDGSIIFPEQQELLYFFYPEDLIGGYY